MTKIEFAKFARERGYIAHYSGKIGKHFLKSIPWFKMDINKLINRKS